jgi:hypothetical protein
VVKLYDFEIHVDGIRLFKRAEWGRDPDEAFTSLLANLRRRLSYRVPSDADVSYSEIGAYVGPYMAIGAEQGEA